MNPPLPSNESERLNALHEYKILDTPPEEAYDDIVELAAHLCNAPIALISLVDRERQWFKSRIGLTLQETRRDISFCAHAILNPNDVFIVNDALHDERFAANPLVTGEPHIRFYAGMPLVTSDGTALGTLCVIDRVPRELTSEQAAALRSLRRSVIAELELRRHTVRLKEQTQRTLELKSSEMATEILGRIRDGFVAFDRKMNYTYVNRRAGELFGRNAEELVGKNYWTEFPEARETPFANAYLKALETQLPIVLEDYYAPWDRWFENRIYPSGDGLSIFFTEITERKRAEESLRESEHYNRTLFQEFVIGLALTRMDGKLVDVNAAFATILGRTVEETLQLSYWDITPVRYAEEEQRQLQSLKTTGRYGPYEKEYIHKDGHLVPVRLQGLLIERKGEQLSGPASKISPSASGMNCCSKPRREFLR